MVKVVLAGSQVRRPPRPHTDDKLRRLAIGEQYRRERSGRTIDIVLGAQGFHDIAAVVFFGFEAVAVARARVHVRVAVRQ